MLFKIRCYLDIDKQMTALREVSELLKDRFSSVDGSIQAIMPGSGKDRGSLLILHRQSNFVAEPTVYIDSEGRKTKIVHKYKKTITREQVNAKINRVDKEKVINHALGLIEQENKFTTIFDECFPSNLDEIFVRDYGEITEELITLHQEKYRLKYTFDEAIIIAKQKYSVKDEEQLIKNEIISLATCTNNTITNETFIKNLTHEQAVKALKRAQRYLSTGYRPKNPVR